MDQSRVIGAEYGICVPQPVRLIIEQKQSEASKRYGEMINHRIYLL